MDPTTEQSARLFLSKVREHYSFAAAYLFGSRARGVFTADSDTDIAVLLRGEHGPRSEAVVDMAGIAFDVMLETGVLVDPLPLWEDEWEHPEEFPNPDLIRNIRCEGIRL
ncbi:MAG: nucleotidyltransferase domain-containing protein [Gammaproteobacteria bacterium]